MLPIVYDANGNPCLLVQINGSAASGGAINTNATVVGTSVMQPVDIQNRLQTTTQTHNAVSVALSGTSTQTNFIDTAGFDTVAVTVMNDVNTQQNGVNLFWSNDGTTLHGSETLLASAVGQTRAASTAIKARYLKVQLTNGDASAAHTMSAWAYLKA
jgi:hypothetical protein